MDENKANAMATRSGWRTMELTATGLGGGAILEFGTRVLELGELSLGQGVAYGSIALSTAAVTIYFVRARLAAKLALIQAGKGATDE